MTMHVIRFSGNERLSERLSWHLFGCLRRKRIGRLKAVREVRKGGLVTRRQNCIPQRPLGGINIHAHSPRVGFPLLASP